MAGRVGLAKSSLRKHQSGSGTGLEKARPCCNVAATCEGLNTDLEVHGSEMSAQGLISFT